MVIDIDEQVLLEGYNKYLNDMKDEVEHEFFKTYDLERFKYMVTINREFKNKYIKI